MTVAQDRDLERVNGAVKSILLRDFTYLSRPKVPVIAPCVTTRRQLLKKRHSSSRPFDSPALALWKPVPAEPGGIH